MANIEQNNVNPFPKWHINRRISAKLCSNDERRSFTKELFGPVLMLQGESLVLDVHKQMTGHSYSGHWHYFKLSNDGLYMAPEKNEVHPITWGGNGLIEELTSDASGMVATLFALNAIHQEYGSWQPDLLFDLLQDFAREHAESQKIFRILD